MSRLSGQLLLPRLDIVVDAIATFSKSGHQGQLPALCLLTAHCELAHASLPLYGSLHFRSLFMTTTVAKEKMLLLRFHIKLNRKIKSQTESNDFSSAVTLRNSAIYVLSRTTASLSTTATTITKQHKQGQPGQRSRLL